MVHSDWEEGVKNAEDLFAQIKLVKRLLSMNQITGNDWILLGSSFRLLVIDLDSEECGHVEQIN